MKRKVRAMQLRRETLRLLSAAELQLPQGAAFTGVEGFSCVESCYINTCYDSCGCDDQTNAALAGRAGG